MVGGMQSIVIVVNVLRVLPCGHNWHNPGFFQFCQYYRQNQPQIVLPTTLVTSHIVAVLFQDPETSFIESGEKLMV